MLRRNTRKKGKNEKIEKMMNVVKKGSEYEKRKADERKKEKNNKPKGYHARKMGVVAFWFIFVFMTLIFVVTGISSIGKPKAVQVEVEENKAVSYEAVAFAQDFLHKYYSWTDIAENRQAKEQREKLLSRYVTDDLVSTLTKTTSDKWNSSLPMEHILLKNVEDVGDNKGYLTFKINPLFSKTQKAIEKELETTDESQIVKQLRKVKFVTVKIYFDEETKKFAIYELPSYTYMDETENKTKVERETKGLKTENEFDKEILTFLETFFDSYANDSVDKLSYLFENQQYVDGLNETMEFLDVVEFDVYKGKDDEEKIVTTTIRLKEPDTEIEFLSQYTLVIINTDQGFLVRSMNDKKYIDDVIDGKVVEEKIDEE